MNKKFILLDKTNNIQKEATSIIKFNYENIDYLVYSVDESNVNKQIFVSRLVLNSEGKTFIDSILPEEKNKLNTLVYNLIILTPLNAKKGSPKEQLLNDINDKLMVKLSTEIPELGTQEYYANSSMAITNNEFVEDAIKLYSTLEEPKVVESNIPTWTVPNTENNQSTQELHEINNPSPQAFVEVPVQNPQTEQALEANPTPNISIPNVVDAPQNVQVVNNQPEIPNSQSLERAQNTNTNNNSFFTSQVNNVEPNILNNSNPVPNSNNDISTKEADFPNPQADKLGNVAVVSDPSLKDAGFNIQPNLGKQTNAGFTLNKYIVIGTVCILLAIAVVIVAYILIQKKTNGV